jgi:predicted nuclease of predicted toxin-antitoxin system
MTAFVADEHIPRPSIQMLREAGYDVLSIRETYPSIDDTSIIQIAQAENRLIISCDRDFGKLLFLRQIECGVGIVYLRLGDFSVTEPAEFVMVYLEKAPDIFNGKFSVIDRERIRQRTL